MKKFIGGICALVMVAAVAIIALPAILVVGASSIFSGQLPGSGASSMSSLCADTGSPGLTVSVDPANLPTGVAGQDAEQLTNAAIIMQTAQQLGFDERGQLIGIMTAMQESKLRNLPGGDRDSVGLFQQRPSQGWGKPEQLRDPNYAARAFYQGVDTPEGSHVPGLADKDGWQTMRLTEAAQAVQGSAFPEAYAQHEAPARTIMAALANVPVADASTELINNTIGCDINSLLPAASPGNLPTQQQLKSPSAGIACPEGATDLGPGVGGVDGNKVAIRLCSIPGTICTGSDCRKGELGGRANGEVVVNSLVAPHFILWLAEVRADGYDPTFNSSYRSWESQERISRGGSNGNAARPGHSNHQMGTAVDIGGFSASYTRNNCTGHAPDGACMTNEPQWKSYWTRGAAHGATMHDEEFWHLEWIVTRAEQRNIPWLAPAPTAAPDPSQGDFALAA